MAKLKIDIGVKTSGVKRGLNKVKGMFKKAGGALKSFATSGLGLLGIGASITGIVAGVRSLINSLDQVGKTARNVGLTAEELQTMEFAMRRSGGTSADVTTGMRRMTRQINDLKRGLSTAVKVFDELGIKQDDLKGKSPHETFKLLATALSGVADPIQKAAIAQELFGRGGIKFVEMAANYQKLSDEAQRLGIIIGDEDVKAAEKFNDELENLQRQGIKAVVDSGLLIWLSDVLAGFSAILDQEAPLMAMAKNVVQALGENIANLLPEGASKEGALGALGGVFGNGGTETAAITDAEIKARSKKDAEIKAATAKREEIKARTRKAQEEATAKRGGAAGTATKGSVQDKLTSLQNIGGNLASVNRVNKTETMLKTQIDIQKAIASNLMVIASRTKPLSNGSSNLAR